MVFRQFTQRTSGSQTRLQVVFIALLFSLFACSDTSNTATGPSAGDQTTASGKRGNQGPLSITVRIDLAEIREQIPEQAKVFVFVRKPGERMPIEVEAYDPGAIPKTIKFTAQDSETAVTVFARVSLSGKVEKSAGDFETSANAVYSNPSPVVDLTFDQANAQQHAASDSIEVAIQMAVPEEELAVFPDTTRVFVIAKAPGSPMPLAVKAFTIAELPETLALSDADAMMPTRPLSSAQDIEVSARISLTGGVSRATGDWEGVAGQPQPSTPNNYTIIINKKIE